MAATQEIKTMSHSLIHVGRVVRFFAGYGGIDGLGAIVAVHGTPNPAPAQSYGGVVRVIRPNDCRVDVILFDGRRVSDVHQCGIDQPGIGIKLTPEVLDSVDHLPALAAQREAEETMRAIKARADFEAAEAARVITDAPIFYWNGIKDERGGKLQPCWYSDGELLRHPAGTITIYARDYCRFSAKVSACFDVQNDTDSQVDYFDDDRIRVIPAHPLYAQVKAAMQAAQAHNARRSAKWAARHA